MRPNLRTATSIRRGDERPFGLETSVSSLRGVVEGATPGRAEKSADASTDLAADIAEANHLINEAGRLIGALRNRFPHRTVMSRLR